MPKIIIPSDKVSKRGSKFNSILRPLLRNPEEGGPTRSIKNLQGSKIAIIGYDKQLTPDYSNWRFATFHNKFRAVYYEIWLPTDIKRQHEWYITKAYLNIYAIDRSTLEEKEYICLHSDPESDGHADAYYRKSPHLHIKTAEEPIPKAHIALANYHLEQILASEDNLFRAIAWGVELICDEILKRIP